jgi:hypothetical protein
MPALPWPTGVFTIVSQVSSNDNELVVAPNSDPTQKRAQLLVPTGSADQQWTAAPVDSAGLIVNVGTGLVLAVQNVDGGDRVCAVKYGPSLARQTWLLDHFPDTPANHFCRLCYTPKSDGQYAKCDSNSAGTGLTMLGWDSGPGQAFKAVPVS